MDELLKMKKMLHRLKVEKFYRERKYHNEISELNQEIDRLEDKINEIVDSNHNQNVNLDIVKYINRTKEV